MWWFCCRYTLLCVNVDVVLLHVLLQMILHTMDQKLKGHEHYASRQVSFPYASKLWVKELK